MSYMVEATVTLMRGSNAAVLSAMPPQPQIPMMLIRSGSTFSHNERKSTAAMKSSVLMSGDAIYLGSPELSPVKEGSKAIVINPLSAIVWA